MTNRPRIHGPGWQQGPSQIGHRNEADVYILVRRLTPILDNNFTSDPTFPTPLVDIVSCV